VSGWLIALIAAPFIAFAFFAMQEWSARSFIQDGKLVLYQGFLPDREVSLNDITRIEVTRRRRLLPTFYRGHVSRLFAHHVRVRTRSGRTFLMAPGDAEAFARELAFSSGAEAVWVD
jgi:hypothetical protein